VSLVSDAVTHILCSQCRTRENVCKTVAKVLRIFCWFERMQIISVYSVLCTLKLWLMFDSLQLTRWLNSTSSGWLWL